ncbi:MAG: hypothetical protein PHC62_02360 [Candidatus Izemoplasmatales bacterium]|jgi:hypothetical protein|nr:hypothetical protein [Candidatus Izemoplasmatales bacterium]
MKRNKLLLVNSILVTVLSVGTIPFFLKTRFFNDLYSDDYSKTLYILFFIIYLVIMTLAIIFQWKGYSKQSKLWIYGSSFTMFLGGWEFFWAFVWIIPIIIINLIASKKLR